MKVVFVVGATASGKSNYALERALKNQSDTFAIKSAIVNCDSVQVYQGLKIGSALPSAEEMSQVPHFLYAYVPKGEKITAGQYSRAFFALMENLKNDFQEVLVVGGTGFYFQAIEKGMFDVGGEHPEIREQLQKRIETEEGAEALYEEFRQRDPESAKRIFPKDHYRLVRAMELMLTQNKTLSEIQKEFEKNQKKFPWPLEKVGIQMSKEELLPKVQQRTKKMLQNGLIEEVKELREQGLRTWAPMESVGYKEVNLFLDGSPEIKNLASLEEQIIMNTMRLAKKQKTWFQRDAEIGWLCAPC